MDEKKFAVILHNTSGNFSVEMLRALGNLEVPAGYSLKILPVEGAEKFRAYNAALNQSNAKYKIYLDEHAIIRNERILFDLLTIFSADKKIGLIGTSGAVELSTHGICLHSAKRCGKVKAGGGIKDWGDIEENFREVDAVDGWFIATQFDVRWREDLFPDKYFGDTAQCVEFKRRGYKVVVVNQKEAWLALTAENFSIVEQSRLDFLREYSADIFPLVSVIIPTFNRPKYFKEALESVLAQTYRHFEIVISDDGTNDETEKLIQPYLEKYPFIKYFRNLGFTSHDNWNFLRRYDNPQAEYVQWLMDDDLLYPRKFEVMVEIYRNNPDVSLVTSVRDFIDAAGKITERGRQILPKSGKVRGGEAGSFLLIADNWIGEPTTVLIRKKFLREGDLCWNADETGFFSLVDVSTWLQLLTQGDMFWITEPLSAFRRHSEEATHWSDMGSQTVIAWAKMLKTALDRKVFLKTEQDIRRAFLHWFKIFAYKMGLAVEANHRSEAVLELEEVNVAMGQAFHNGYEINLPRLRM